MKTHVALAALLLGFGVCTPATAAKDFQAVNGTTGTPLGGFGAGAVKFNANDGSFAAMTRPPADAYDFQKMPGARFQFFAKRGNTVETADPLQAAVIEGRPDDDAIWPIHRVNFGTVQGIQIRMIAFSPLDRVHPGRMSLPYAFYEITLKNDGASNAIAACALQWDVGEGPATLAPGKGFASRAWAVYGAGSGRGAVVTAGSGEGFFRYGSAGGATVSGQTKTAVRVALAPKETKRIRFVLAWYNETDPELSYYLGLYKEPGAIAGQGLTHFDALKANAVTLVDRMRASNLPEWLENQTLNTLANLVTNSMYKRDGRVAFAEGQWTCFGTMDQMWHARQIVSQMLPFFAWQELRYWARTQRKDGQIHHDFNDMDGGTDKVTRSVLVGWDDTEHKDYRNIDKWVDLNCAFILSVFETYQITGDRKELDFHWPYVKRAAQRILDQVEQYGSREYPYTFQRSENSYDAGGDPNPFNATLSAVAYKVMVELARDKGENNLAKTYGKAYDTVVASVRSRYLKDGFKPGKHSEGYFAGQWLALHLKLGEIWTAEETDRVLKQLNDDYHPYYRGLGNPKGTYDEWTPYLLVHYGGLLLNTRRENQWQAMQHDAYTRQYHDRNKVFSHPLDILPRVEEPKWIATDFRSKKQYISLPGLWRNYYDIVGYHRDRRTKALWLKPIVLEEMNHRMTDALYLSPEGDGAISCIESGQKHENREITFRPDNPIEVNTLHLADHFGDRLSVTVNGRRCRFQRVGAGYARELVVNWSGVVGRDGLRIVVTGDPGSDPPALPEKPAVEPPAPSIPTGTVSAFGEIRAANATQSAGTVVAEGVVTSCNNFDYLRFDRVDFGKDGATGFVAKVKGLANGASIDIVLDSVSGDSIGTCAIPTPGANPTWTEVRCPIKKTTGVHNVILRFFGASPEDLLHLDSLKFTR